MASDDIPSGGDIVYMVDSNPRAKIPPLNAIRAISFDGDDTLWDFETAMLHGLTCVLEVLRRQLPGAAAMALTVAQLRALRDAAEAEMPDATLETIRMEGMRRAVQAAGGGRDDALAQALFDLYMHERYDALELYPDAEPALKALGARYPLAIVSNGNTDVVRMGLQLPFAVALFAAEVGYAKPDPRIFYIACQRLGCARGELLHVRGSLENGVAPARAAGVHAVWLALAALTLLAFAGVEDAQAAPPGLGVQARQDTPQRPRRVAIIAETLGNDGRPQGQHLRPIDGHPVYRLQAASSQTGSPVTTCWGSSPSSANCRSYRRL